MMLESIKNELLRLAADPADPFHGKVRKRIGRRATQIVEKRLRQLIMLMPALIRRIHGVWRSGKGSPGTRKLGGFVFAYLYHPHDFLAEDEHGLFGYLDDACLVADVYQRVMLEIPSPSKEDQELLETVESAARYVKMVIPDEDRRIKEMVEKALNGGEYEKFAEAFQGAA